MEELIDSFAASEVTPQVNSTARDHPRFSLYKVKRSTASQEERRRIFLEAQKLKKYDYASHARGLATNEWDENEDEENEFFSEDMDLEVPLKPSRSYKNQLMLSEWLVEVPSDLGSQWLLVFCPVGKRCLVVSSRGTTKVFTKSGYMLHKFSSKLPGGSRSNTGKFNAYSLLDCIYNELDKTYYILDVMCWNSHPCFDSETEFRFYWLKTKVEECAGLKTESNDNPYKFVALPNFACDKETIKNALWSPLPFKAKLDGLLFYHKRTHYICGTVPLVGWLKAYMLPEILQIDVPDELCTDKPSSYVSMQEHIPEAFKKNEQRKQQEEKNMLYEDD